MPIIRASLLFLILSATLLFSACKDKPKAVDEGRIIYKVSFPNIQRGTPLAMLLPKKMQTVFKGPKTKIFLSIGMGTVKLTFLADADKQVVTHIMEVWGNKYICKAEGKDLKIEQSEMPNYKLTNIGAEGKEIAGWNCKKAHVIDKTHNKEFDIYYSDELGANSINWHSPYRAMEACLMEYYYEQMNMNMYLTAKEVIKEAIDDDEFVVDGDYEVISKAEFDNKLKDLMESVGM